MRFQLACTLFLIAFPVLAIAQEKPVVFISGNGNLSISGGSVGAAGLTGDDVAVGGSGSHSTVSKHDQTMEMVSLLMQSCPEIELTLDPNLRADYSIALNREGQATTFGELGQSQVMVANARRTPIFTGKTLTVKSAVKHACNAVVSDWRAHGRLSVEAPAAPVASKSTARPAAEVDIALVFHSTDRAVRYCKPETVSAIQEDLPKYLQSKGYVLGQVEKSEIVIEVTIDRPLSKWIEITVTVKNPDGVTLVDKRASNTMAMTGSGALTDVLTKIHTALDKGLPPVGTKY